MVGVPGCFNSELSCLELYLLGLLFPPNIIYSNTSIRLFLLWPICLPPLCLVYSILPSNQGSKIIGCILRLTWPKHQLHYFILLVSELSPISLLLVWVSLEAAWLSLGTWSYNCQTGSSGLNSSLNVISWIKFKSAWGLAGYLDLYEMSCSLSCTDHWTSHPIYIYTQVTIIPFWEDSLSG